MRTCCPRAECAAAVLGAEAGDGIRRPQLHSGGAVRAASLNVESVAWIAERKTVLSTLFLLLALGAYRWYASHPDIRRYLMVAGLFAVGLMCKPQIIMFPLVLLLWDYWPLQRMFASDGQSRVGGSLTEFMQARSFWWLVKEKVPLFFLSLVDAALTLIAQHVLEDLSPTRSGAGSRTRSSPMRAM